jgi:hypothetical protein
MEVQLSFYWWTPYWACMNSCNKTKYFVLKTQTLLTVSCVSCVTDEQEPPVAHRPYCEHPCYVLSNGRVIGEWWIGKDVEGTIHLPVETEDNHRNPLSRYPVSRPRFEPGTSHIWSRSVNHLSTMFGRLDNTMD